jgi:hypothetical protein
MRLMRRCLVHNEEWLQMDARMRAHALPSPDGCTDRFTTINNTNTTQLMQQIQQAKAPQTTNTTNSIYQSVSVATAIRAGLLDFFL